MLTDYGFRSFLTAIGKPYGCRLWTQGCLLDTTYPCDPGYPKVGDTDPANTNRGDYVLTWRYTIPRGTSWGASPANEAQLMDGPNPIDRIKIPDFMPSASHPTVLYLNLMLRR